MVRPAVLFLALAFALPALASAQNDIRATILGDALDADLGDDICDVDPETPNFDHDDDPMTPELGQCTLRAAIQTANATAGPDRILLRPNTYVLTIDGPAEDAALSGDLDVTSEIEVVGVDYLLSFIDAGDIKDRIFDVQPGGMLTLTRTSLLYGGTAKDDFDPGAPGEVSGGCVRSAGVLAIDDSFLFRCKSKGDGGCVGVIGGSAEITNSIFAKCRAKLEGGAIDVNALASATVDRVTIGACQAASGGALAARGDLALSQATLISNKAKSGGGVAVLGDASASVANSTLASNKSGNLASQTSGVVDISSSILWDGKKGDCLGPVTSGGGNLEGGTSCAFSAAGDQQNQDPLLLPLEFNGGPIPTAALEAGSPAIDRGLDVGDVCTDGGDARTRGRVDASDPADGVVSVDAGAFEFGGAAGTPSILSLPTTTAIAEALYEYDVQATSEAGRGPCRSYSLVTAPTGMTIDAASGLIGWTPALDQVGSEAVTVRLDDANGLFDTQGFTIAVEAPPPPAP